MTDINIDIVQAAALESSIKRDVEALTTRRFTGDAAVAVGENICRKVNELVERARGERPTAPHYGHDQMMTDAIKIADVFVETAFGELDLALRNAEATDYFGWWALAFRAAGVEDKQDLKASVYMALLDMVRAILRSRVAHPDPFEGL